MSTPAKPSVLPTTAKPMVNGSSPAAGPSESKPQSTSRRVLEAPLPKRSNFESRSDALKVVESLNTHLGPAPPVNSIRSRVQLASNVNPASFRYRYMFEKLMDRADALDRRIDEAAELMRQHYQIEELGDPSLDSQEDCVCVGRICTDFQSTKLHDPADKSRTSIWLESSRLLGSGSRTELRFDSSCTSRGVAGGDGGAGLFPGALVGVRGRNVGGQFFNVTELLMVSSQIPLPRQLSSLKLSYERCCYRCHPSILQKQNLRSLLIISTARQTSTANPCRSCSRPGLIPQRTIWILRRWTRSFKKLVRRGPTSSFWSVLNSDHVRCKCC